MLGKSAGWGAWPEGQKKARKEPDNSEEAHEGPGCVKRLCETDADEVEASQKGHHVTESLRVKKSDNEAYIPFIILW